MQGGLGGMGGMGDMGGGMPSMEQFQQQGEITPGGAQGENISWGHRDPDRDRGACAALTNLKAPDGIHTPRPIRLQSYFTDPPRESHKYEDGHGRDDTGNRRKFY